MIKTNLKRTISFMLMLCMVFSLLPVLELTAAAAESTIYISSTGNDGNTGTSANQAVKTLQQAYKLVSSGGSIVLMDNITVTEMTTFSENKSVTITSNGTAKYVISAEGSTESGGNFSNQGGYSGHWAMLVIRNGSVTVQNVAFDANGICQVIATRDNATGLTLNNATVTRGSLTNSGSGAGIHLNVGKLEAKGSTVFTGNVGDPEVVTSGGALYVGENATATLTDVSFNGNKANSGGAIYNYGGTVTMTSETQFSGNEAGQRGGAIHNHGDMILNGTEIKAHHSKQLGGAIYNSASDGYEGKLVLNDVTLSDNTAGTSGGAVYIAAGAEVYVTGNTAIQGNSVDDYSAGQNNVFVSSSTAKLYASGSAVLSGDIGVSAANPYSGRVLVDSLTSGRTIGGQQVAARSLYSNPAEQDNFTYDSEVWLLEHTGNQAEDVMWLKFGDPNATSGSVYFVANLPGEEIAQKYEDRPIGSSVSVPTMSVKTNSGITFDFKGWYDAPEGGTKAEIGSTVEVEKGPRFYYAQWNITGDPDPSPNPGGGSSNLFYVYLDQNYDGGGITSVLVGTIELGMTVDLETEDGSATGEITETIKFPFSFPSAPRRVGYTFMGWNTDANASSGVTSANPTSTTTYYAIWKVDSHTLTWNANGGSPASNTTQDYGTEVVPTSSTPTRAGYDFTGWYVDVDCSTPLGAGTIVYGDRTFYAGWKAIQYQIDWNPDYTGASTITTYQDYDDALLIQSDPVRYGYQFGGWYTGRNGTGTRAESYGTVRGDEIFYAYWVQDTMNYTVTINWADHSDNDAVRPDSVIVELLRNGLKTEMQYEFTADDAVPGNDDTWQYTFTNLPAKEENSVSYVYSVAIVSSVGEEYETNMDFAQSAYAGYIIFTHKLITRDVDVYIVWDDKSDNDGYRPATVDVELLANGEKMDMATVKTIPSNSGDTWTGVFPAMQKYYTKDENGQTIKRQEIQYSVVVTPTNAGELRQYDIAYSAHSQLTAVLSHNIDTVSKTAFVEWQDNNNQDNMRPASMMVQLYADSQPVAGCNGIMSDANSWRLTWNDLPKYRDGGVRIVYSAQVTSTLVDYTAKSTEMVIEMTYVPQTTSIPAYITWTDENDVDGLRPDYLVLELLADGKATGDAQVISDTNNWATTWTNYPAYKAGSRVEYTFRINEAPAGYDIKYYGIYDTSGLSAILTHERIRADLETKIVWDDQNNISGSRPAEARVMLYADGIPVEEQVGYLNAAGDWKYTFAQMPVYRNGGVAIKYSAYVVSEKGIYKDSTVGMTITMSIDPQVVDVPLNIVWDDSNNANGTRPGYVIVTLLADGEHTKYTTMATVANQVAENQWSVVFEGMTQYEAGANGVGRTIVYSTAVTIPDNYDAIYSGTTVLLTTNIARADYTAQVHWTDDDNRYGERPEKVTLTLYADYGDGPVLTGKTAAAYAADDWQYTFKDLQKSRSGIDIIYSVTASGNIGNYTAVYDYMDVYLTHKYAGSEEHITDYTAEIIWQDNRNEKSSRPYGAVLTLYANGIEANTYTMTSNDISGEYTWSYTWKDLPTYDNGVQLVYTVGIDGLGDNYKVSITGDTITLTHVQDIPVTVIWEDFRNDDGLRLSELTLRLYEDGSFNGVELTQAGDMYAGTWSYVFEQVPVWDTADTTHEVVYTFLLPEAQRAALASAGYGIDYNEYEMVSSPATGGELTYTLTLTRTKDIANYRAVITWVDDADRDGLRPTVVPVELYADYRDGNGAISTGLSANMTGGNEDDTWEYVFASLPVKSNQGETIYYSLRYNTPADYLASPSAIDPSVRFEHILAETNVTAAITWDDASNTEGLTRSDITVELVINGERTGNTAVLHAENSWTYDFGSFYVYYDHGKINQYTFIITDSNLGDGYEVDIDDMTGVVKRKTFMASGSVVDEVGYAVSGATVTVYDASNASVNVSTTDEEGKWSIDKIPNGDFTARATYVGVSHLAGEETFTVSRSNVTGVVIVLDGNAGEGDDKYTYTITGTVKDSNGAPASGAAVYIWDTNSNLINSLTTDASGSYTLAGLKNGTYQASVLYTYEGEDYTATSNTFTVYNANLTVPVITVQVPGLPAPEPDPCVVDGYVVDQDKKPLENIIVLFMQDGDIAYILTTDKDGHYETEGVPDGTYQILYHYAGTVMAQQTLEVSGEKAVTLPTVTIDTSADTGYGTLEGIVLDDNGKPVEGAEVYVYDEDDNLVGYQVTGPDGKYRFKLPVGNYRVVIKKPYVNDKEIGIPVDDDSAEHGTGIDDVNVTADSFTISGYVYSADDEPIEGAKVYLYEARNGETVGEALRNTETDGSGYYEFRGLEEGEYIVKVIYDDGTSDGYPLEVKPNPGDNDGDITVVTDSYTLSGTVRDDDGEPVKGAIVTLYDSDGNQVGSEYITAGDGYYEFAGLDEGVYTIHIRYPDSEDLDEKDVTVDEDKEEKQTYTVSGTVKDQNGNVLSGAAVVLSASGSTETYSAVTNANGVFKIDNVPSGSYTITATYESKTASKSITVKQDAVTGVALVITLPEDNGNGGNNGGGTGGGNTGGGNTGGGNTGGGTGGGSTGGGGTGGGTTGGGTTGGGTTGGGNTGGGTGTGNGKMVYAYVNGYPDGTFRPDAAITRAEVAAIVSRVTDGYNSSSAYASDFTDVLAADWYASVVGFASERSYVTGYTDGSFKPNNNITRAEFAAIVARYAGMGNTGSSSFADAASHWATGYIAQLVQAGIITGYDDGTFRPDASITRAEAVTMMNRALGRTPDTANLDALDSGFSDVKSWYWAYYQVLEAAFDHYHG